MRTSFPTLPASQIKWEKGIARALKRIMGRQGVIMALASNPLNSLKTRERGQETERSEAACNPCQVNLASRAAEGGEGREQVTPAIQPSQRGPSGMRAAPQWVLRCPDSSLLCKGKVPVLSLLGSAFLLCSLVHGGHPSGNPWPLPSRGKPRFWRWQEKGCQRGPPGEPGDSY